MADLTTAETVSLLLDGDLSDSETGKVDLWIRLASGMIRQAVPSVDERVQDGSLDPDLVSNVAAEMVVRAVQSSRIGYRVRSEAFPEVQVAYQDQAEPWLFLYDHELAQLQPRVMNSQAFTIRPRRVP